MSIRRADKAGSWYPGEAGELRKEVEQSLLQADRYLAKLPAHGKNKPVAAVVPHAGLSYSGGIAATAFKVIRDAFKKVDVFLTFGACHRQRLTRPAVWAKGAWETPLGNIDVDTELADFFIAEGLGEEHESPHLGDNAIELQTPFIKALFPEATFLPVAMDFFPDAWKTGEKIAAAIQASERFNKKTIVALASTDMTHYGASFGITPAGSGTPALEWTRKNDARLIEALTDLRLTEVVAIARKDQSACGAGAAAAIAGWAKALGCRQGQLLAYATSYDIAPIGKAEHFVGYSSILYESEIGAVY